LTRIVSRQESSPKGQTDLGTLPAIPADESSTSQRPYFIAAGAPMPAGVTKRLWEIDDILDVLEAWEAASC